jgi:hypothetical protein
MVTVGEAPAAVVPEIVPTAEVETAPAVSWLSALRGS